MERKEVDQAKLIYETVRMLQDRVISRHVARGMCGMPRTDVLELTLPQMNMVMTVRDLGQATVKELAERLRVSAPSVSTMVDRLVEMGALTREQSQVDRREVVIRISPVGENTISVLERQILESLTDLLERLGPEYAQMWCDVYGQVRAILRKEGQVESANPEEAEAI